MTDREREAMKHQLYKTSDPDRPDVICDRNGEVVLGLCKVCGLGEAELDRSPECPGPRPATAARDLAILKTLHAAAAEADVLLLERADPEATAVAIAGAMYRRILESDTGRAMPELTPTLALALMTARQKSNAMAAATHLIGLLEAEGFVIARKLPGEV